MRKLNIKDFYITNVKTIDDNTKKLVKIINNLISYINIGSCKIEISDIIFSLIFYADKNIKMNEEVLIKEKKYSDKIKAHNKKYIVEILSYKEKFKRGERDICVEMCKFLKNWLENQNEINKQLY